jgi:hypothetical protein
MGHVASCTCSSLNLTAINEQQLGADGTWVELQPGMGGASARHGWSFSRWSVIRLAHASLLRVQQM